MGISIAGAAADSQTEDQLLDGTPSEGGAAAVADAPLAGAAAEPGATDGEPAKPAAAEPAAAAAAAADNVPSAMPKELTALLKDPSVAPKLQAVMPQIQSAFDQLARIREVFPTVRAVHEFAETFPGGLEEAKAAQQKSAMLDEADDQFGGPPEQQRALAEEWITDNPDAFKSMFVQSAALLRERDPQGYEQITGQVFHDRLESSGFAEQIEAFRGILAIGNKEVWAEKLPGYVQWLVNKADELGVKWTKTAGRVDPAINAAKTEREAAAAERSAAFKERLTLFSGQVGASVHTSINQSVSALTTNLLKDTAFSDAGKTRIRTEIISTMDQAIKADRNMQRQIARITQEGFRSGNTEDAKKQLVTLLSGRAKQLLPATAKKVIAERTAEIIASNSATNDKRAAAGARTDVGAGGASPAVRTRKLTVADTAGMSDEEILNA